MDKIRSAIGGQEQEDDERGIVDDILDASSLSWSTRIKGFVACFAIGCILSLLGTFLLFTGGMVVFAVCYTIGNIIALSGTFFLMGPLSQLKKMFAMTRLIATIVMLVALVLTLMAALWWDNPGLTILFVIIQFVAMLWYSISYIPYARDAVKKCAEGCMGAV